MKNVWNKRRGAVFNKSSLLIWDMFVAHRCEKVKKEAESLKTILAIIPGGLTPLLQPLDICLRRKEQERIISITIANKEVALMQM